jgi:hypothetical protein
MMSLSSLVFSLFVSLQPVSFEVQKFNASGDDWIYGQKIETLTIVQNKSQMCFTLSGLKVQDSLCMNKNTVSGPKYKKGAFVLSSNEGSEGFVNVQLSSSGGSDAPIDKITIEKNLGTKSSLYLREFFVSQIEAN